MILPNQPIKVDLSICLYLNSRFANYHDVAARILGYLYIRSFSPFLI
jgi:hypothetical protein